MSPFVPLGRLCRAIALAVPLAAAPLAGHGADDTVICYAGLASGLIQLADLRGFYAAEGVAVALRRFPSGKDAMAAMFAGTCDLASSADIPVVHHSLGRSDFRILASTAVFADNERILARADHGIMAPADLRGHRIAVTEFTSGHYFLDLYLAANGLTAGDVVKVFLPADQVAPAIRRGEVDAVAHWDIPILADELGTLATVFSAPGLHVSHFLLTAGTGFVAGNPAKVRAILRALVTAERFARDDPAKARALLSRNQGIPQAVVDQAWPLYDFSVSLGQPLPFLLENAARWRIALMPADARPKVPNYLDIIHFDGLTAVKPDAVTVIR